MSVRLTYTLTGRGWAECRLAIDGREVRVTASYLSDALSELLAATVDLVRGSQETRALFADEPGQTLWRLQRIDEQHITIELLAFEAFDRGQPEWNGRTVYQADCRLATFAGAVASMAQTLIDHYGMEGYREVWGNAGFPMHQLIALQDGIKQMKRRKKEENREGRAV